MCAHVNINSSRRSTCTGRKREHVLLVWRCDWSALLLRLLSIWIIHRKILLKSNRKFSKCFCASLGYICIEAWQIHMGDMRDYSVQRNQHLLCIKSNNRPSSDAQIYALSIHPVSCLDKCWIGAALGRTGCRGANRTCVRTKPAPGCYPVTCLCNAAFPFSSTA